MIQEHEAEPVRGLPGRLPEGEHILWQGAPDWRVFTRTALHSRWMTGYFAILALLGLASGSLGGVVATLVSGVLLLGMLALYGWGVGRTTVYTITNKRVVLRVGVALSKCINLPLGQIASADLRDHGAGRGDIALGLTGKHRLGYAVLWPHARPWHFGDPQPMLRALPDVEAVAARLAEATAAVAAIERTPSQNRAAATAEPVGAYA